MNTEWRWNRGVERKQNHRENAERFSIYIFCIRNEAMSRICACKTKKNLQIFGRCLQFKQSCLWATLSYFCLRKQSRKINAMRRVVFWKCIKKSSALSHIKYGEVSLQIEFATLPPKPQPLCEMRMKRKVEKQGKCGHRLIVNSITRRGEIWKGQGGGREVKR